MVVRHSILLRVYITILSLATWRMILSRTGSLPHHALRFGFGSDRAADLKFLYHLQQA
jgi:hypothetical protein